MQEQGCVPPPFFQPKQLELVFDLRSQIENQVHHGTLMIQCIYMLYNTFSNAPEGQIFPTSVRPYMLPTQDGLEDEDVNMATSEADG
jgi:hypothetical protein